MADGSRAWRPGAASRTVPFEQYARRGLGPQPKHPDFEQKETEYAKFVTLLRSLRCLLFEASYSRHGSRRGTSIRSESGSTRHAESLANAAQIVNNWTSLVCLHRLAKRHGSNRSPAAWTLSQRFGLVVDQRESQPTGRRKGIHAEATRKSPDSSSSAGPKDCASPDEH